jgi:hypothetical protein
VERKKLPFGDPDFKRIIEENQLYADKTKFIHGMLNHSVCCFLSRPRRFGKTLLLDTISELFQGDRVLFKDQWIGTQSDYNFARHPVLTFNMSYANIKTVDDLASAIAFSVRQQADAHEISLTTEISYGTMMEQLIDGLYKKNGVRSVILVDEYDAPVTEQLADRNLAFACLKVLHGFYASIKKCVKRVHFAFVTGITRFAMTAVDSGANNFSDISLDEDFAGICGFTRHEIDVLFEDRFEETLKKLKDRDEVPLSASVDDLKAKIMEWYDGYNWLGNERVLNPYSIINFFHKKHFGAYWPLSGRLSHLSAIIRDNPLDYLQPGLAVYSDAQVRKTDLSDIGVIPVLFHSGYVTIDKTITITRLENNETIEEDGYTFKIPNKEVRSVSKASIFNDIFKLDKKYISDLSENMPAALLERNSEEVIKLLRNLLVSIPYHQHPTAKRDEQWDAPGDRPESEKFYHGILHGSLLSAGFDILSEVSGAGGRADIVLSLHNGVRVVIELKYRYPDKYAYKAYEDKETDLEQAKSKAKEKELTAALDSAEAQLRSKDYAGPHRAARHKVICLAIAILGRSDIAARFVDLEDARAPAGS